MVEIVNEQWKAEVSDLLQQETDRLKALARAEVDDFWVTHYKVRENEPFKDWGLLGVRIRDFKYGFGIEWYINSFHGQRGKRVVFSKGLRISKTKLRYAFLDCQGLATWPSCSPPPKSKANKNHRTRSDDYCAHGSFFVVLDMIYVDLRGGIPS